MAISCARTSNAECVEGHVASIAAHKAVFIRLHYRTAVLEGSTMTGLSIYHNVKEFDVSL